MKNKDNTIKFIATSDHVFNVREKPIPASEILPRWWKDLPHYATKEQKMDLNPRPTVTVKRCLSAYDGIASGYVVTLWADILVSYDEVNGTTVKWNTVENVFDVWSPTQSSNYEIPKGFGSLVFKYLHGWIIKTPKGYSSQIMHPVGYQNLPFRVIPGIVDTDNLDTLINTPLVFEKGWEGIIEKGTPIFQVLPFKRDSWKSEVSFQGPNENYLNDEKLQTKIVSYYGKYLRKPKTYR
jgi:hypothetical protein